MTESYRCWAEVDLDALRENLSQIRTLAGREIKILTVVKADAYGHGLRQIAAALMQSGTDLFGVANLAEARAIRMVGKGWPILMLGACLPSEVETAVRDEVMPTISMPEEAERFSRCAAKQRKTAAVHVKVDTGMGRLGVPPDQASALMELIDRLPAISIKGIYTHFSSAEDDAEFTTRQRKTFETLVQSEIQRGRRFTWIHARGTGGLLHEPDPVCNTVRPGLLVYGLVPAGQRTLDPSKTKTFRPALRWKCRVSLVRTVPKGTPVSYGHTYMTKRSTRLATITAGYGDGYFRAGSNHAQVLIRGQRCPVAGRVTMDQMVIDASAVPNVEAGDEVVLIGEQGDQSIGAGELAEWCNTIAWEVLTNITYRVPRIYRGGSAA